MCVRELPSERVWVIHNEVWKMCGNRYKYLGTIYYDHLKFVVNTEAFVKRGQQRIHLLHKLNSLSVGPVIFCCFYKSFIESLLRCSFICCFHSLTVKERNSLNSIVNICSDHPVKHWDLGYFCNRQIFQKAAGVSASSGHVLTSEFSLLLLPSGRRYALPACRTNRHSKWFIPNKLVKQIAPSGINKVVLYETERPQSVDVCSYGLF